jgi:ribosomal protein S18 acetylase RimI-like enzyme
MNRRNHYPRYDESENATHILLRLVPSLKPIGTIRCVHKPDGNYKLSRLAVLKEYRQYGFGRLLVEGLHSLVHADARANGKSEVAVLSHSQIPVKAFYARYVMKVLVT